MSKKSRVHYTLSDTRNIHLSDEEIKVMLRAADEIIFSAGRDMLVKILKGSKSKKLLEYRLDECSSYGYYNDKTLDEISVYVDCMIKCNYLDIEYSGRLPMIVFSEKGWETYKPVYADDLYQIILETENRKAVIDRLKNTNREIVTLLLDKIGHSSDIGLISFLKEWKTIEAKKVRVKIDGAIKQIQKSEAI